MLGKAALALLREHDLAVHEDVVLRLCALVDLSLVPVFGVDLGCETRGPAVVARSDGAVVDLDARHRRSVPAVVVAASEC
jgi:hypothetical protein